MLVFSCQWKRTMPDRYEHEVFTLDIVFQLIVSLVPCQNI